MTWINAKDIRPEDGEAVLGCLHHWNTKINRKAVLIYVNESDCSWRIWGFGGYNPELSHDYTVTHWMPLPEPPKE